MKRTRGQLAVAGEGASNICSIVRSACQRRHSQRQGARSRIHRVGRGVRRLPGPAFSVRLAVPSRVGRKGSIVFFLSSVSSFAFSCLICDLNSLELRRNSFIHCLHPARDLRRPLRPEEEGKNRKTVSEISSWASSCRREGKRGNPSGHTVLTSFSGVEAGQVAAHQVELATSGNVGRLCRVTEGTSCRLLPCEHMLILALVANYFPFCGQAAWTFADCWHRACPEGDKAGAN